MLSCVGRLLFGFILEYLYETTFSLFVLVFTLVMSCGSAADCDYDIKPVTETFGGEVGGINVKDIDEDCASKLKQEAFMYRFLLIRGQSLAWQDQVKFTEQLGTPFRETSSINRKKHENIPDPRLGYFSNDRAEGLTSVGVEGWHVDGNVAEAPHLFTIIYCISNNKNGPTLVIPLREIVEMLNNEERKFLEKIHFVSGYNSSIVHALLYKDPNRNDDTIMLALGKLSGQYLEEMEDSTTRHMSTEETKAVMDLLEVKVLSSNKIYAHQYQPGDLMVLYNPSIAHIAGPGSQTPREISGLRLMSRTTVIGEKKPSKTSNIKYKCSKLPPFENGYCLFSLKGSLNYPQIDLAVLPTEEWNEFVRNIISCTGEPHWVNAQNPEGSDIFWEGFEKKSNFSLWDPPSGQPNDHNMYEDCVVIGPYAHWFDLPCSGLCKNGPGLKSGPVMVWEDGKRHMFNVFPLCGVDMEYL
ncbi:hypothetical protein MAR_010917, partial [Mya arenaria]